MKFILTSLLLLVFFSTQAQQHQAVINAIIEEGNAHSHLEQLSVELLDDIGPRLVGSPQMQQAHDWTVTTYGRWGIKARNEQYGEWKAWERGHTFVEMISPRTVQLEAIQMSWSPATPKNKPTKATVISLPEFEDSISFIRWLPQVKGKIVLISPAVISGRPESNWKEFAVKSDYLAMLERRKEATAKWNANLEKVGLNARNIISIMEEAGASAIVSSTWTEGWGTLRITAARTKKIPHVAMGMEDYNLLLRFLNRNIAPQLSIQTTSRDLGKAPTYNTLAEIKGLEKPDEYVILSAHIDSWDGGTGATDNGTGSLLMMEVMRILKKVYPNPKRTILAGHWGGEEQGLNGSRAFVADHPEIMDKISVVFNQDNGTGRISFINGNGFLDAYDYFDRWLSYLPEENKKEIKTNFPGSPGRGNSDYASFVAVDVPAFFLIGNNWDYSNYTWHTNRDTYDKLVFDDLRKNAITIAILTYLACEEQEMMSRRKAKLPLNIRTNERAKWPQPASANRTGE